MKNKLEKIKKIWNELSPIEALYINILARYFILKKRISKIHPKKLVIPICMIQVCMFTIIMVLEPKKWLEIVSITNIIIVGIAIFPMTIKRKQFHYIGE